MFSFVGNNFLSHFFAKQCIIHQRILHTNKHGTKEKCWRFELITLWKTIHWLCSTQCEICWYDHTHTMACKSKRKTMATASKKKRTVLFLQINIWINNSQQQPTKRKKKAPRRSLRFVLVAEQNKKPKWNAHFYSFFFLSHFPVRVMSLIYNSTFHSSRAVPLPSFVLSRGTQEISSSHLNMCMDSLVGFFLFCFFRLPNKRYALSITNIEFEFYLLHKINGLYQCQRSRCIFALVLARFSFVRSLTLRHCLLSR